MHAMSPKPNERFQLQLLLNKKNSKSTQHKLAFQCSIILSYIIDSCGGFFSPCICEIILTQKRLIYELLSAFSG